CTFSLSHGSAELTLSKDSVLCLLVRSTPMRFRAVRISPTNVILMEEVPQQQTLLLSQGTSLPIAFDSAGEPGVTLAFLKAEGGTATISAVFPQKISILKTSIAVAPEPVIPEPSSVPPPIVVPSSPKLEVTAAPLTEHPAPPPRGFQIPYFWIGLSLIAIIIGIVLSAAVAHRKHPELRGPDHLLNPKLAAELQNFGIRPEDAAKRIAEKERRK
ncbi:MAG TPA: hypothetical protein VJK52_04065, partial [Candidatus Nanoarchaeia archaeon]|nr:hypothetical protein [Candidatus Nanoarchaeia archaeon]